MLTITEAKPLALQHIARLIEEGDEAVINDALTLAKPYGWVFFYNSREFYESGNPLDGFGGNGPAVVTHEGAVHLLGSSQSVGDSLAELEAARGWRG